MQQPLVSKSCCSLRLMQHSTLCPRSHKTTQQDLGTRPNLAALNQETKGTAVLHTWLLLMLPHSSEKGFRVEMHVGFRRWDWESDAHRMGVCSGLDFGLRNTHGVGVVGRPRITHVLSRRTVVDGVLERGPIVPILAWRATGIGFGVSELKFRYLQIVVLFPYSPLRGP